VNNRIRNGSVCKFIGDLVWNSRGTLRQNYLAWTLTVNIDRLFDVTSPILYTYIYDKPKGLVCFAIFILYADGKILKKNQSFVAFAECKEFMQLLEADV
jgi:hypothetical protein